MGRASINPLRFVPEFKIPYGPAFGDKPFFGKEDLKIYGELGVLGLFNQTAYDSAKIEVEKPLKAISIMIHLQTECPT